MLAEKINRYLAARGKISGIDVEKEKYPDLPWMILAVASLSKGQDEIFRPDYVPSAEQIRR